MSLTPKAELYELLVLQAFLQAAAPYELRDSTVRIELFAYDRKAALDFMASNICRT